MRTLAIGDIHGCYDILQTLLGAAAVKSGERLILLGDLVDRGPKTRDVIQWAIENPLGLDLRVLRGNHEVAMLAARNERCEYDCWVIWGGSKVLASYEDEDPDDYIAPDFEAFDWTSLIPPDHWEFIERTLPYLETETEIFVHASLNPVVPLTEQDDQCLYWDSFLGILPHQSGKRIICGHTSQYSGLPFDKGFATCIDTRACRGGWLTCLDTGSNHYWQANADGEIREGDLQDLAAM